MRKVLATILCLLLLSFSPGAWAQSVQKTATLSASSTNCATANSCLVVALNSPGVDSIGSASFDVSGTFSGTLTFEAFGGNTWQALNVTPSNSSTATTTTTSGGLWQANVAAYTQIRVRCSSYSSGSPVVVINLSKASR